MSAETHNVTHDLNEHDKRNALSQSIRHLCIDIAERVQDPVYTREQLHEVETWLNHAVAILLEEADS